MCKKVLCLAVLAALVVSVFGCSKKAMELDPQLEANLKGIVKMGVCNEV